MTKNTHSKYGAQTVLALVLLCSIVMTLRAQEGITRYVRYSHRGHVSYGILDGGTIRELRDGLFDPPRPTGETVRLSDVKLLVPIDPMGASKVLGVAMNSNHPDGPWQQVAHPRFFAKMPTSLNGHEGDVELPPEAANLNYEGELAFIIGRKGRHIPVEDAPDYVFGVSVGNDFSENSWYSERQETGEPTRLISKGTDTWACLGPAIVTGIDYSDLGIEVRLNGDVVARGRTKYMINDIHELISYISRYMTLLPGDVIYTGTVAPPSLPGKRRKMQANDVVEVEIENVGLLRNTIVSMKPND